MWTTIYLSNNLDEIKDLIEFLNLTSGYYKIIEREIYTLEYFYTGDEDLVRLREDINKFKPWGKLKRIAILTSGGDAPGMNPAIRAVVRASIYNNVEVWGIREGFNGLIKGDFFKMGLSSVADIIQRGGTILRTSRSDEFMSQEGFEKALDNLELFQIDGLIVLGGDGSLKGAEKLYEAGVNTIGIPCTIDNDCEFTDYTIGFQTAVETVLDAITKIRDTSTSHGRANIIEVMGRDSGDIALYSGLAGGAESIIVPEIETDFEEIVDKAIQGKKRGKRHHIIVLAEGGGDPYQLAERLSKRTGIDTRVTILGYIQRGGSPSAADRILASQMGFKAVEIFLEEKRGRVLASKDNKIIDIKFEDIDKHSKKFQEEILKISKILSI